MKLYEQQEQRGMVLYERPFLSEDQEEVLHSLVWEEWHCRNVGEGGTSLLHIWRHPHAIVLGLRDRRLPGAEQAMKRLRNEGWSVCVRPSGGAAVALDSGVVNLSFIVPNRTRRLEIHDDFKVMASFIREAVRPWSSEAYAGEIEGSFCPGDYDISIEGRKFCGIAQRRQAKATIITAFVLVEGSGRDRADSVRSFYEEASMGLKEGYPLVTSDAMGSLQELAGVPSSVAFIASVEKLAKARFGAIRAESILRVPKDAHEHLKAKMMEHYDH